MFGQREGGYGEPGSATLELGCLLRRAGCEMRYVSGTTFSEVQISNVVDGRNVYLRQYRELIMHVE